jgi:hypothetical protein
MVIETNQPKEPNMSKLLAAYLANPSAKNAQKLVAYDRKHPMAACMLNPLETALLAQARG